MPIQATAGFQFDCYEVTVARHDGEDRFRIAVQDGDTPARVLRECHGYPNRETTVVSTSKVLEQVIGYF